MGDPRGPEPSAEESGLSWALNFPGCEGHSIPDKRAQQRGRGSEVGGSTVCVGLHAEFRFFEAWPRKQPLSREATSRLWSREVEGLGFESRLRPYCSVTMALSWAKNIQQDLDVDVDGSAALSLSRSLHGSRASVSSCVNQFL